MVDIVFVSYPPVSLIPRSLRYDTTIAACVEGVDGDIKSHLQRQWYRLTNVHIHNSTISNHWSNFASNRLFDALHNWHKTNECKGATRGASEYCLEFLVVQEKPIGVGWCRERGWYGNVDTHFMKKTRINSLLKLFFVLSIHSAFIWVRALIRRLLPQHHLHYQVLPCS